MRGRATTGSAISTPRKPASGPADSTAWSSSGRISTTEWKVSTGRMASSQVGSVAGARSGRCSGAMATSDGIEPASVSQSGTSSDQVELGALALGKDERRCMGVTDGAAGCGAGCSSSLSQSDFGFSRRCRRLQAGEVSARG